MSQDDKKKKGYLPFDEETGDEGSGGTSGSQGGQIEFHDFLSSGEKLRDDLLPAHEKNDLLNRHQNAHKLGLKKQKDLLETRKQLKEGKIQLKDFRDGFGQARSNHSQYKTNPVIGRSKQFTSSTDKQVNFLPTEQEPANDEKRNELQYQHQLRHQPNNAPRFHPKPQFRS